MSRTVKIVLGVLLGAVLAAGLFFAGQAYGRSRLGGATAARGLFGRDEFGRGFFGHRGMMGRGSGAGGGQVWAGPGGMMGPQFEYRVGPMMGPGLQYNGGPMMGQRRGLVTGSAVAAEPLTIDEARVAAQEYVDGLEIEGLALGEVMIFDNNAYVVVTESGTGLGAFELLVDPISKLAYPEHGPNMMWNQKYGSVSHGLMMGGRFAQQDVLPAEVSADMPLTEEQAREKAQAFLDTHQEGAQLAAEGTTFYGYYTFDYEIDGKPAGMLSVNGFSGAVFPHLWHGTFIEEAE